MEPEGSLPHSQMPTTVHILNQLDPVHTPTPQFLEIQLNIILPSTTGSPKRSLSLRFPHQNPVYASLLSPIRATCPSHLILLDFITRTIMGENNKSYFLRSKNFNYSGKTKVKVKVTLVQALRLCTGRTAYRGSRGIDLPFHDHGTRRGWEVRVRPQPLFTPGKDPVPTV